jgi:hypothetical protein
MFCAIKVSIWWFWNVSGHLPTNRCRNVSICSGFCRFGCHLHLMVAWCCTLDKSEDSDLRDSWLPKAVHLLLLFAMVKQLSAIMCCILHVLWHSVVSDLCFLQWTWHMGNLFVAIYSQSEHRKSDLVVFYNSLACYRILWGPQIAGPSRTQNASHWNLPSCNG